MTVRIVTDSSADLPVDLVHKHQITVVPCYVVVDDQTFKDGVDIQADEFYRAFSPKAGRRPPPSRRWPTSKRSTGTWLARATR